MQYFDNLCLGHVSRSVIIFPFSLVFFHLFLIFSLIFLPPYYILTHILFQACNDARQSRRQTKEKVIELGLPVGCNPWPIILYSA